MHPMLLPDVERNPQPGPYRAQIELMQQPGAEYPQIWHLFAYLPRRPITSPASRRRSCAEPAPISPGLRELIAAYTSRRNDCPF